MCRAASTSSLVLGHFTSRRILRASSWRPLGTRLDTTKTQRSASRYNFSFPGAGFPVRAFNNMASNRHTGYDGSNASRDLRSQDPTALHPSNPKSRIYILGVGGIGKLVAHSIRTQPDPPPVTLLFHTLKSYDHFIEHNRTISVTTGDTTTTQGGFTAERVSNAGNASNFGKEPLITNLIVTVKAHQTVAALKSVLHRLTSESTILFLQNGMGTVDEVTEKLFSDPNHRPTFLQGVNSHGVYPTSPSAVTHAGKGTIMIGLLPNKDAISESGDLNESPNFATSSGPTIKTSDGHTMPVVELRENPGARYLVQQLTRVPVLAATGLRPTDLLQMQLEKLVGNCIVNPLTVMFDCQNGALLYNFAISRTIFLLLAEISLVIQSLPELKGVPNVKLRFSPERLNHIVTHLAQVTALNYSSMLQDARLGKKLEVEYINGYIVRRGEELGIKAVMNYMLMQMVLGKQQMISKEMDNHTQFDRPTRGKL